MGDGFVDHDMEKTDNISRGDNSELLSTEKDALVALH